MKTFIQSLLICIFCALLIAFASILSSCHALVVADKLYYQGTIGKKQASLVEFNDTSMMSIIKSNSKVSNDD